MVLRITVFFLALLSTPFALEVKGAFTQGGYIIGHAERLSPVTVGNTPLMTDDDGFFFYGLQRYAPAELTISAPSGSKTVIITPRDYKTQHVNGVPAKTVNPDNAQRNRSAADTKAIKAARANTSGLTAFRGTFIKPVAQYTLTGEYGSRRTYNGEERSWHKGADFAAPTGTPIKAPAAGVITLARDTFFNGNLIILDHGQGLFTIYAHLDSMKVNAGDSVAQGQIIGAVGTTGRSTGPHLHWGAYWHNVALDPLFLLKEGV